MLQSQGYGRRTWDLQPPPRKGLLVGLSTEPDTEPEEPLETASRKSVSSEDNKYCLRENDESCPGSSTRRTGLITHISGLTLLLPGACPDPRVESRGGAHLRSRVVREGAGDHLMKRATASPENIVFRVVLRRSVSWPASGLASSITVFLIPCP